MHRPLRWLLIMLAALFRAEQFLSGLPKGEEARLAVSGGAIIV